MHPITLQIKIALAAPVVSLATGGTVATFGSNLTLTCTFNSTLTITNLHWFINGRSVDETSREGMMSTLRVVNLQEEGFYQCYVRTENGNVGGASTLVSARGECVEKQSCSRFCRFGDQVV